MALRFVLKLEGTAVMSINHVICRGLIIDLFEDIREAKRFVKDFVERREVDDGREMEIRAWEADNGCK